MEQLIAHLRATGILRSKSVSEALRHTDRINFVSPERADEAYNDYPLPIGYGQTISQPTTVVFMLELLQARRGENILDVGSGSGWTTALLAHLVGLKGSVCGVEIVPELVTFGSGNLRRLGIANATIQQAEKRLGFPELAPYDRILVSAAATELPLSLVDQLKSGGTLVIPVENAIWRVKKDSSGQLATEKFEGFVFVPLV